MNCDQAFDAICSPVQESTGAARLLQQHLATCQHCKELAATLQPAVLLMTETVIEPAATPGLKRSNGASPWLLGQSPQQAGSFATTQPEPPETSLQPRRRETTRPGIKFWQATSLALLVALGVTAFQLPARHNDSRQAAPVRQANFQPDDAGRKILAAMQLPATCLNGDPALQLSSAPGIAAVHCCTTCHSAAAEQRTAVHLVAMLQHSCQACH